MKKYFLLVLISFLISTFLPFYLYSAPKQKRIQKKSQLAGIVTNTKGKVQVSKNGKEFKQAKIGDFVYEGDTVKTLKKSQSAVTYTNGTIIKSNQNTEYLISIAEQLEKIGSRIKMASGQIWTKVRPKTKFEIKTPVAVVAVRGTEFDLTCNANKLDLAVYEGTVNLKNEKGEADVNEGEKTSCTGDSAPEPPKSLKDDEKEGWQDNITIKGTLKIETKNIKSLISVPVETIVSVYDNNNKIDKETKEQITLRTESAIILFSLEGKTWEKEIKSKPESGTLKIFYKGTDAGTGSIVATAENYSPATLDVSFDAPKNKNLKIKIKTDTGEEDLILKFQKK
ncbi:MAG: hypothetical protein A2474_01255 [Elusimicrobia bacterium RIFOXYC2_FULL_34_12]|nr:MAG: hypothetical protein A2474_01255 [Elusimicrobia bacterium RIFOXYC2_FULL_34_12]